MPHSPGTAARRPAWGTRPWLTGSRRGRDEPWPPGSRSDELLLVLAFSGGGTRAAAFAYGVLEELAATPVMLGGQSRRLLDEVDLISAVSGGSFTAAYYGLYGDRIFRDFETDFLKRPVERELVLQLLRPRNWVRLGVTLLQPQPARGGVLRRASVQRARHSPISSIETAPRS